MCFGEGDDEEQIIILGDVNLDSRMQSRPDYPHKALYELHDEFTPKDNLI